MKKDDTVAIKTITIKIGAKELTLTPEQAQALKRQLLQLMPEPKDKEYVPYYPWYPWYIPSPQQDYPLITWNVTYTNGDETGKYRVLNQGEFTNQVLSFDDHIYIN